MPLPVSTHRWCHFPVVTYLNIVMFIILGLFSRQFGQSVCRYLLNICSAPSTVFSYYKMGYCKYSLIGIQFRKSENTQNRRKKRKNPLDS